MKRYTAIITATILVFDNEETVCAAIPSNTFTEACEIAEDYFGKDLLSIHIELIDTPLITFSEDIKNKIIEEL